jgi:flagellar hook assembly protein FlgD
MIELDIYPNPFKVETRLTVNLPKADRVKLSLYNLKGQLVRELCDEFKAQGQHSFTWDGKDSSGRDVPVGIYLVRYDMGRQKVLKKVTRF